MSQTNTDLETRVRQSLARLELSGIGVSDLGEGIIKMDLKGVNPNDKALACALVQSVPGVRGIRST